MRFNSAMGMRAILAAITSATIFAASTQAQTFTWTNAAGGNWSVGANWGGSGPAPGGGLNTILNFGPNGTYTTTNDLAGAFLLNQLNFTHTNGTISIAPSGGSSLNFLNNGSAVAPTINMASGNAIVSSPITLTNNTTVTGSTGAGSLTLSGALSGSANSLISTSAGNVALTGGGSINRFSLQNGTATIGGGATFAFTSPTGTGNVDAGIQLGAASGQSATLTVTGAGTVANVSENTYIGDAVGSTGTIIVSNGAVLNSGTNPVVGVSGRLAPGNQGTGTLTINSGGQVNALFLFQSRFAGSNGTITVDGAGSSLNIITNAGVTNSGQFTVGNQSTGTMTIQNGATATGRNIIMGNTGITGTTGAGNGFITVTGAGSQLIAGGATAQDSAGNMTVASGTAGSTGTTQGRLDVLAGGRVDVNQNSLATGGTLFSAVQSNAVALINVDGANSQLNVAGQFSLGGGGGAGTIGGTATMNITNNGAVTVGGLALLAQSDGGGLSTMNLNSGGTFTAAGQFQTAPGTTSLATANVNVLGGSRITINNTAFFAIGAGSNSSLTVNGANSIFETTGTGQIQFGGAGTTTGGTATVNVGSGGIIRTSSDPAALVALFANATVNVNSGGTLQSPAIGVSGRLIANGAVNGNVVVNSGGFLGGTSGISGSIGTITGNVNVNSGGTIRPGDGSPTGAGILTVTGTGNAVTLASGANFSLNVNGPTPGNGAANHGQLLLTGGATIDVTGSTLQTALGYAPAPGQVITFIQGGAVTGTFNGLPDNQLFLVGNFGGTDYFANIRYTSNSVFFTVVPEPVHILGLGAVVMGGVGWWRKRSRKPAQA
jgi:T5SS/PEP-CTERM-associated repeat protein